MSSCLIALAGECQLERLEENFDLTIAVDGGFDLLERLNIRPSIFVGDCDSIEDASKIDSIKIKHILPTDKDVTDFDESLEVASELGCEFATVIGGLSGPRIDMVISNLEVASRYARQGFFIHSDIPMRASWSGPPPSASPTSLKKAPGGSPASGVA